MKAVVIHEAGGPEVLKVEKRPIPVPHSGQVLIRVKAFGLNRSELFTRQGHSPGVPFPRILGIEAVGLVEDAPGKEFHKGAVVATAMGGMGRQFDGGYAEYTCVPVTQVQVSPQPYLQTVLLLDRRVVFLGGTWQRSSRQTVKLALQLDDNKLGRVRQTCGCCRRV